jgi:hypothetical protein
MGKMEAPTAPGRAIGAELDAKHDVTASSLDCKQLAFSIPLKWMLLGAHERSRLHASKCPLRKSIGAHIRIKTAEPTFDFFVTADIQAFVEVLGWAFW